jgi:two-component system NtrC family sensor kinase
LLKKNILIIEDEAIIAMDIRKKLENNDYNVTGVAFSGEEAIRLARKHATDLVLTDIVLKGDMDGIEVANFMRSHWNIPVIFLTAHSDEKTIQRAKSTGPFGFLKKPVDDRELRASIEMALYKSQLMNELQESERKLNCLFRIGEVLQDKDKSIEDMIKAILAIIPPSWQYPDITCARIILEGKEYTTKNFKSTVWKLAQEITINNKTDGRVEVFYTEKRAMDFEGPFTKDERDLINAIAARIGNTIEQKKTQEALEISEKKYRTLFENSKETHIISTPEGEILDINQAGLELFGFASKEELLNTFNLIDFYSSLRERAKLLRLIQKQGYVKDFEITLKRRDGSQIIVRETSTAIRDENGHIIELRGTLRDVTAHIEQERLREQMLEELQVTNKKLKETQSSLVQQEKLASIGQLAAGVAHELNNPLGFVMSNFNSLHNYYHSLKKYFATWEELLPKLNNGNGSASDEGITQIEEIKKQENISIVFKDVEDIFSECHDGFQRMTSIVKNLKDFSRIDHSEFIETYDLHAGIESTLVVARNEYKYVAEIEESLSDLPLIECNGGEINQVLLNIIVNAAHAIKSQGREDTGKISIKTYCDNEYVFCEIRDDGPGIPEQILGKIFDPFFTTKDVGSGTGLGLSISYDIIVNKHKGDLTVESKIGEGTSFTIKLPVKSANMIEAFAHE